MSGVGGSCEYVFDPQTRGGEGAEISAVDADMLNDDGVWRCPHDVADDENRCIFHRPVDDKADDAVADALSDAFETAVDGGAEPDKTRATEFVGATLPEVRIKPGTVVEAHVRFDHASVDGGFVAEDVAFERGLSATGATFGAAASDGSGCPVSYRPSWSSLEDTIDDDHHGAFPSPDADIGRHVSFRGADFDGRVTFAGANFEGVRHVSFAHADFGGDGDVSFARTDFENRGHVAFNKADFENRGAVSFEGAVFESHDVSFSVIDFENDGDVSFESAVFRDGGDVAFRDSDFTNHAAVALTDVSVEDIHVVDFRHATFIEDVSIGITTENVGEITFAATDFSQATLDVDSIPDVNLESADLTGVDLSEVDLSGVNLERARLTSADLFGANLSGARIYGARTGDTRLNEETKFDDAGEGRCVYDPHSSYAYEQGPAERVGQIRKAMGAYHVLEQLSRANTLPDKQARFFARRQDMRRRQLRNDGRRLDYWFAEAQNAIFRHGESFSRVVAWALGTIVAFAFVLPAGGWVKSESSGVITYAAIADAPELFWQSLYHSALLFLTGRGPLTPTGFAGELLTTVEAMVAPILLALLVFVLGRRAAR